MKYKSYKIAIIISEFNNIITENLLKGALKSLKENGIKKNNISIYKVPGSFEIPLMFKLLCTKKNYDGIITLGCIIKGETAHFEYVSEPVAHGLNRLSVEYSMPHGFGILTVYTPEQAFARSRIKSINEDTNKGYDAANAVLKMIEIKKKIL